MDVSTLAAAIALMKKIEKAMGTDYETLKNKPVINGVELSGSVTLEELGVDEYIDQKTDTSMDGYVEKHTMTPDDIDKIIDEIENG